MTTAKKAENFIWKYFKKKKGIELQRGKKGSGCDFHSSDGKMCVEVKGTASDKFTKNPFHYFTNAEFKLAKSCHKEGRDFQMHFVAAIKNKTRIHYIVPGSRLIETAKKEAVWSFPIRADFDKNRVVSNSKKTTNKTKLCQLETWLKEDHSSISMMKKVVSKRLSTEVAARKTD
jgi:hypothetical protein